MLLVFSSSVIFGFSRRSSKFRGFLQSTCNGGSSRRLRSSVSLSTASMRSIIVFHTHVRRTRAFFIGIWQFHQAVKIRLFLKELDLRAKNVELTMTNRQLARKNRELARRKRGLARKNRDLMVGDSICALCSWGLL
eukprot:m.81083 g.81083  ORF g.81083 m.81083 type:complete len:136 (+) comp50716_c0_seq14:825-1232(+)